MSAELPKREVRKYALGERCKHGQLARKCSHCESEIDDKYITDLETALLAARGERDSYAEKADALLNRVIELEAQLAKAEEVLRWYADRKCRGDLEHAHATCAREYFEEKHEKGTDNT